MLLMLHAKFVLGRVAPTFTFILVTAPMKVVDSFFDPLMKGWRHVIPSYPPSRWSSGQCCAAFVFSISLRLSLSLCSVIICIPVKLCDIIFALLFPFVCVCNQVLFFSPR